MNKYQHYRIGNQVFNSVDALTQFVIKHEWVKYIIAVDYNGKEKYLAVERSWKRVPIHLHEQTFRLAYN